MDLTPYYTLGSAVGVFVTGVLGGLLAGRAKLLQVANAATESWKNLAEGAQGELVEARADSKKIKEEFHLLEIQVAELKAKPDLSQFFDELKVQRQEFHTNMAAMTSNMAAMTQTLSAISTAVTTLVPKTIVVAAKPGGRRNTDKVAV